MSDQGPATPARRKRTGRPTKFTPEVADRIVEAVGHGLSYADVCRAGNVSERTFYRWKQRGQEATRGRFWQFWQRIEAAAAKRAIAYLEAIDRSVLEPVTIRKTRVQGDAGRASQGDHRGDPARRHQGRALVARAAHQGIRAPRRDRRQGRGAGLRRSAADLQRGLYRRGGTGGRIERPARFLSDSGASIRGPDPMFRRRLKRTRRPCCVGHGCHVEVGAYLKR